MKASDYIVEYLINKGITDVFGYPGGMVTHLMDSFSKYPDKITAHVTYHEQGAAFAACGYAQASGKVGVAYATSGPGATNLITGICNAYYDSIPTLFITGQVNTFESKGNLGVRQRGFQETDIVSMVQPVTKYAIRVEEADKLKWYLDYAFMAANEGRKGPVLLDIPMNIFRADIAPENMKGYEEDTKQSVHCVEDESAYEVLVDALQKAEKPVLIVGNGVKIAGKVAALRKLLSRCRIPVVTTMLAVDVVGDQSYGFIGAYGTRYANFIVAKSDLVITLGARLDVRQVGAQRDRFAPDSTLIRVDIDEGELQYKVHDNEIPICADLGNVIDYLDKQLPDREYADWKAICDYLKECLHGMDERTPNRIMKRLSDHLADKAIITTDVGQNQVWVAQSLEIKNRQRVFFSGGHGAMGYSLPASIGCAIATGDVVYSFNGDGGIQMNIQELQTIVREQLPIKIILVNNVALGMIRHFQEMYFEDNYYQTVPAGGYTVPDFKGIAQAYKIPYHCIESVDDIDEKVLTMSGPEFLEIKLDEPTYVFPKLEFGKPNQDQEPLMDRDLFEKLMKLDLDNIKELKG